ncbi:phage protein Gp37/Gp68 domain protein [Leptospira kirschneri str. H2]|nr:phage protein Gp37/Gp68 domain protein [Leptospira kirschneri str. H2]
MKYSGIEWTDHTWNPVTGCTKVSAGCKNCYAETLSKRKFGEWKDRSFSEIILKYSKLKEPFSLRKPSKIFVNSMSDLFHKDVPDSFIDKVFGVMALNPKHTSSGMGWPYLWSSVSAACTEKLEHFIFTQWTCKFERFRRLGNIRY